MSISPSKSFLRLVMDEDNPAPCTSEDPELFFPNFGGSDEFKIRLAKAVCKKCPVATQLACLEFALVTDDRDAILAGTTPGEREVIKLRRENLALREARRAA